MTVGQDKSRHVFEVLNGLRGIAAIAVTMTHLSHYLAPIAPKLVASAVDFFFILSGFVIASAYEQRLRDGMGIKRFALARVIRLYPMYLVGLIMGAVAVWIYEHPPSEAGFAWHVFFNLFMLPSTAVINPDHKALFPLNFVFWSLLFELLANLVYALIGRRLSNGVLGFIIAAGFAGLVATGLITGTLDKGVQTAGFLGGLARVTFCFFAGVALYRLWLARPLQMSVHPALLFVLLALPFAVKPEAPWGWYFELAVVTLWMPVMVWLGAASRANGIWLPVSAALGALSYPLYVIHAPVWTAVRAFNGWQGNTYLHEHAPVSGVLLTLTLMVVAWALDRYFDHPVRKALAGRLLG
jgi:peptidoglycan/LPS O-acetylase OafA/YrhL